MLWQGTQNISLDVSTLRQPRFRIKQKSKRLCAETVDAAVSLWKLVEKQDHPSTRFCQWNGCLP
jgi:hypothetical protein